MTQEAERILLDEARERVAAERSRRKEEGESPIDQYKRAMGLATVEDTKKRENDSTDSDSTPDGEQVVILPVQDSQSGPVSVNGDQPKPGPVPDSSPASPGPLSPPVEPESVTPDGDADIQS